MQEGRFRNKIYWFNFLLCIQIIWIHSYNIDLFLDKMMKNSIASLEFYISNVLARTAVPGFIMVSGYLFYRNFSYEDLFRKWHSRLKTVVLPYIIWNSLYYLGYAAAGVLPAVSDVVDRGEVGITLKGLVKAALFYEFNPVFWFMYQLILLILLAPLLYLILKRISTALLFFALLLYGISRQFFLPHLNLDATLYYSIAAFFSIHFRELSEGEWSKKRGITGGVLIAFFACLNYGVFQIQNVLVLVLYHIFIVLGCWMLLDERILPDAKEFMKGTFFIYAFHFIVVRLLNKTLARLFPDSAAAALLMYLMMPAAVILICYQISLVLKKYIPFLWRLLNGGR